MNQAPAAANVLPVTPELGSPDSNFAPGIGALAQCLEVAIDLRSRAVRVAEVAAFVGVAMAGAVGCGALGSPGAEGMVLHVDAKDATASMGTCVKIDTGLWRSDAGHLRSAGPAKVEHDITNQPACKGSLRGVSRATFNKDTCTAPTIAFVDSLKRGEVVTKDSSTKLVHKNGYNNTVTTCTWKAS